MFNLVGKGMYMWQLIRCESGNPDRIGQVAREAGLSHVLIKVADGIGDYNVSADIPAIIASLRHYIPGIVVFGWQYVYGASPLSEAQKAISRIRKFGVDGFVINAEAQYKAAGRATAAEVYCKALRSALGPSFPIGLSSYRYPSYHASFPWKTFARWVDFMMPQVYWMMAHNPAEQLRASYAEYRKLGLHPFYPTGAAFTERGWKPTPGEVTEFLGAAQDLGFSAVNFWSWDSARRDVPELWDVIAQFPYGAPGGGVIDPPSPPPDPTAKRLSIRVEQPLLRVRTGPGTEFFEIGHLDAGTVLPVYDIGGSNAWVRIPWQGGAAWTNVQYGDDVNARVIEVKPEPLPVPEPDPAPPEPDPAPPDPAPGYVACLVRAKTNARFIRGYNDVKPEKGGPRPIMSIYPSDTSHPNERVQFASGSPVRVKREPVIADGGGRFYELAPEYAPMAGLPVLYLPKDDVTLDL
jgi:hypothetical protein